MDIVNIIKMWANDPDAPVPPVVPAEYALLAVDEIERLRSLIVAWVDADNAFTEGLTNQQHDALEAAYDVLRKEVVRLMVA